MELIEAYKAGTVHGINETPEQHIETVLSDVFLYTDRVRKVYKHRHGFANLADPTFRKEFYTEDFLWNQMCSPEIHTALRGVCNNNGQWSVCDPDTAKDYFIEMKRIDDSDTLLKRLLDNEVRAQHVIDLTHNLVESSRMLTSNHKHKLQHVFAREWIDIFRERLEDLREWGHMADPTIPRNTTDTYIQNLSRFIEKHPYFKNVQQTNYTLTVDNHAANVVFIPNDTPRFIDAYLTKEMWRVVDHNLNISRTAACVKALGSDELGATMYDTYAKHNDLAPEEVHTFYECYCALIKMYYYIHLDQKHISDKYAAFADRLLERL